MSQRLFYWLGAVAIFAVACFVRLRIWHPADYVPGFDEQIYIGYVEQLHAGGLGSFPAIVARYIPEVQAAEFVYLPPLRIGYLGPALALGKMFGVPSYAALRLVSAFASGLFALAGFLFARRWLTARQALAVFALLACAPLQIHLAQFAFIDALAGLWAILAIGCLWESLQQPKHRGWLAGTAFSLFSLCCTKQETAVFVALALGAALLVARRFGFATSRWRQTLALALAGGLALGALIIAAGGLRPLAEAFTIYHERARVLPYSILTGDGPWHRYPLEYLLINPLIFLLAAGFVFRGDLGGKWNIFLVVFIAASGTIMTSIPNGMNIRHTVMWDFPLALFAVQTIATLSTKFRRPLLCATLLVAVVCYSELRLYGTIFRGLYDTDPRFMLRAVRILK